jgi:hypothetical protein
MAIVGVGVTRCAHNARVRNQLLYSLMSDVFLLAKEEARYRQPTDVQEPKLSHAAVPTVGLAYKLRGQWDAAEELKV